MGSMARAYWNKQPCNSLHKDADQRYAVEPHIRRFAEFEKWKGKKVFELGCGIGRDALEFIRAGAIYKGMDYSDVSLQAARKRIAGEGLHGEFVQGDLESLGAYPDEFEEYDLVYSYGVLHHLLWPRTAIMYGSLLLKPGGELRVMLYHKYSIKWFMVKLGLARAEAQAGCPIVHAYTRREAAALIEDTGDCKVESIEVAHIFPYIIKEYVKGNLVVKWRWRLAKALGIYDWIARNFGWHILIKARKR